MTVRSGHLQEKLLEIGGRAGKAHDRQAGADRLGEESGSGRIVASEGQLDHAVVEDRRGRDLRIGREPIARALERFAFKEHPDSEHRPEPKASLDIGDSALRQDLALVDDRDAGAQLLELGQDVAADQDRLAQVAQLPEELAQLDTRPRIES